MSEKNTQEKSLFMTRLMTPDMSNFSGKVHGGTILKLLDEAAFTCASRYCKTYVVTKSLDQVVFKNPIAVGDLITFKCNINYVGKTSMEVGVRVEGEKIKDKTEYHAISSYFNQTGGTLNIQIDSNDDYESVSLSGEVYLNGGFNIASNTDAPTPGTNFELISGSYSGVPELGLPTLIDAIEWENGGLFIDGDGELRVNYSGRVLLGAGE